MRSIFILCASVVALSVMAAPAKADSTNTIYAVFDFGGFSSNNDNEEYCYDTTAMYIINLASLNGTLENFLGMTFATDIDLGDIDLSESNYFIIGHILGSDHLVLSDADGGPPGSLDDTFEDNFLERVMDLGSLGDGNLAMPGGIEPVSLNGFQDFFDVSLPGFFAQTPGDVVAAQGAEADLLGFSGGSQFATVIVTVVDGGVVGVQVPEPGLGILAVLGLTAAVIARRRRCRVAA